MSNRAKKYGVWLLDSYVSGSSTLSWCPGAGCSRAIEGTSSTFGVACTCGYMWCFRCKTEDHAPASCDNAKDWTAKNNSDAENVNWIIANTKICPKCKVHIEKNQGCNHMTCKSCRHEFCKISLHFLLFLHQQTK
jgi:ariadne-1